MRNSNWFLEIILKIYMTGMQRGAVERFQPDGLNTSLKILPEYLKEAGYSTHAVGKVHPCLNFRISVEYFSGILVTAIPVICPQIEVGLCDIIECGFNYIYRV